ncbi:MAG TPA: sulfite exporter TauE/SafE family protein [Candidatus Limnocylindrales bacterium]|nr:sulfite exporter TauE/SafE family protein [Candidatus Limnocylindrales bacterium]
MNIALAGLAMGFLGSSHCIAMCGGLAAALPSATGNSARGRNVQRTACYNAGRIASYAVAGAIAGGAGAAFAGLGGASGVLVLRGVSALLIIAVGLYVAGWSNAVVRIERLGGGIWRTIAPHARRARESDSLVASTLFGAMWGWLPCGLVYSALVVAASSGSSASGAMTMAGFGLGTLPAMTLIGVAAGRGVRLLRGTRARQFAGALVIVFGAWTLASAAVSSVEVAAHGPACHAVHAPKAGAVWAK